ncbi:partial Toluene efflux pump outer membrane protein TtgF, partial [Rhodocyclaceae bacterium]
AAASNWLNQLVGHVPSGLPQGRNLLEQAVNDNLAAGIPSEVLLTRPDVMAAEQRLIAANASIGAARAAFLPKLLLTAAFGVASKGVATLFEGNTGVWSYQPSLSLPLFDGGRLAGNKDIAEARKVIAVAEYEKIIQQAFREVADLLSTRATLIDQRQAAEALLRTQEERFKAAQARYKAGVASFLEVLDAQRELFGAQQGAILVRRAQLGATAQLYKALGGGG